VGRGEEREHRQVISTPVFVLAEFPSILSTTASTGEPRSWTWTIIFLLIVVVVVVSFGEVGSCPSPRFVGWRRS
jgi:hypothetical protein